MIPSLSPFGCDSAWSVVSVLIAAWTEWEAEGHVRPLVCWSYFLDSEDCLCDGGLMCAGGFLLLLFFEDFVPGDFCL